MARFVVTTAAKANLKAIARCTEASWGREQRNRYLASLDTSFHTLAEAPQIGRPCDDVRPGYRKSRVGKHLVFYRPVGPGSIEIVRVLHEGMDIEDRLSDLPP